ncbi:MAG: oxygenase MpaB family protein [Chloroflexota bacterium]|nr:oxygenase MpaB family protein [Chloroflexota bacterium]MDE2970187.1 oxygenase MpaB family protein [Chloroflexota bacterium]
MATLPERIPTDYLDGYQEAYNLNPELTANYIANAWVGDPLADALMEDLSKMPREDSDRLIEAGIEQGSDDELRDAPESLWAFFRSVEEVPSWVDFEGFHAGTRMFYRAGKIVLAAFTGGTLVEGFSTNISKSFLITGRLREQGVRRLRQNNRHMIEIFLPDGLQRYGDGWKLSVRLRLVHAQVRRLLAASPDWNQDAWGVPISGAHMGYAAASFSSRTLYHLHRLGVRFSDEESRSFMAVWRYSGFLMGVPEDILYDTQENANEIIKIGRMCEPSSNPESVIMANALINSAPVVADVTDPVQRRSLVKYIYRVSRAMIGAETADQLNFPKSSNFGVLAFFRWQSRYYQLLNKLFPGRPASNSNFNSFSQFLGVSAFDDAGISYRMPDHVYAERSRGW